jgi:signal transduction histidine kinase
MADWRELKRWHIDPTRVPSETLIVNRQYSMWEMYGGRILAASAALALEASLILVLLLELRRRRRVESRMKELSGKLLTAQEEERSRIARELHDDLGQQLAMLGFGVAALQRQPDVSPDKVSERANTLEAQLGRLAGSLRQLSHDLHPSVLDYAGLPAALRSHAEELGAASGLRITVEADERASELTPQVALPLFRVTQEALRNVTKHARATEVRIVLTLTSKTVELAITDNGQGFRPHTTRGLGLQSIDERSRLLGGTVIIKSFPERGATVRLSIPLDGEIPQPGSFTDRDPPNGQDAGFVRT